MTLLVLATGQSNMAGSGGDGPEMANVPGVTVWNNENQLVSHGTAWIATPTFGVAPWSSSLGNNLALWFCARLARETGEDVRLILVAKGTSAISLWDPSTGTIYEEIQDVWAAANPGKAADVFLWHQGEADEGVTSTSAYTAAWLAMRTALISEGILSSNTLSVVGELSPTRSSANQQALAAADDKVGLASSAGLATTDGTHFTGIGYHYLGWNAYWQAYSQMAGPQVGRGSMLLPGM